MMRAKLQVQSVTPYGDPPTSESLSMSAVTGTAAFGPKGESEDNTFARYTPSASFSASINRVGSPCGGCYVTRIPRAA